MAHVLIPDRATRLEIFKMHSRKIGLDPGVGLARLAGVSDRFTGVDILSPR